MTSNEVRQLVEREIANRWDHTNLHSVDLRTSVIEPRSIKFVTVNAGQSEEEIEAWLVLLQDPTVQLGYGIAYEEGRGEFGLVQFANGYDPFLIGLYGGFFDAFDAM